MARKFTPEQTLKLVTLYRDHECLWNFNSEEYKDPSLRRTAYLEICSDLNIKGFKVEDLKIKIKSIRSTYCIEVNKIKKSIRSRNVYKPRVVWFDLLDSFIRDYTLMKRKVTVGDEGESSEHSQQRDTNSNDEQTQYKNIQSESDENEDNAQGETVDYDELDPLVDTPKPTQGMQLKEPHMIPKPKQEPAYEIVQESRSVPRQAKKRKLYQLDSTTNTVKLVRDGESDIEPILRIRSAPNFRKITPRPNTTVDHTYHSIQPRDGSAVEDDEYDTFGRHVATQLRKLSTLKYLLAQEEIQHIITKLRIDDMV